MFLSILLIRGESMSFRVTWRMHIACLLISYFIALILQHPLDQAVKSYVDSGLIFYPSKYLMLNFYLFIILLLIPLSVVHEFLHGITFKVFGGKVKYGFKIIYAYTQEVSGIEVSILKFSIILLAPVTVISLLGLWLGGWLGGLIYILNLLASSGDLLMACTLLKYDRNSKIIDRSYGFDIIR